MNMEKELINPEKQSPAEIATKKVERRKKDLVERKDKVYTEDGKEIL